jgi:hypothetical protein
LIERNSFEFLSILNREHEEEEKEFDDKYLPVDLLLLVSLEEYCHQDEKRHFSLFPNQKREKEREKKRNSLRKEERLIRETLKEKEREKEEREKEEREKEERKREYEVIC